MTEQKFALDDKIAHRMAFMWGGELGLTNYTIKILAVLGEIPPLSVQTKMNANDNNVAPVAVAA